MNAFTYTVASSDVIGERAFVADPWPRRYVRRLHVQQQQTLSATAALQRMRRLRQWLYAAHVLCFNCIADSYYGTFLGTVWPSVTASIRKL